MTFKVFLRPKSAKFLNKLDEDLKSQLITKIKNLSKSPETIGLHMNHCNFWKLRVGDYRAIYKINESEKKIIVLFIGHRKNVYDKFSKVF